MNNNDVSDFESFLEKNPHLKDYKVIFPEPGVAVLSKEEIDQTDLPTFNEVEKVPEDVKEDQKRVVKGPDVIEGPSSKIKVKKSGIHGYGVFAVEDILEDELIEECRLLRLGWRTKYHGDPVIKDYVWTNMSCNCKDCKIHGPSQYIALGNGSLYNHSDNQNTKVLMDYKNEVMIITAKTMIPKGSEIFVNYGKNYWKIREKKEPTNEETKEKISEPGTKE